MYTVAKAKSAIMDGIRAYLKKDENGQYLMKEVNCLPFYLEGAPGIGKTEIVNQIAQEMNLGYVSFSLVHHTRNSLLGLPVIKELEDGDKYTSYTMSEIIAKVYESVNAGFEEGILLLDEFPCMSETIMPAMLAFLQTKNIGTHHLPRGWVMVLCGNPIKYNKSSHTFDAAVTDRIRKIEIEYSLMDFLEYAESREISEYITTYLEQNPEHVYRFVKTKNNEELVTCRSWENLGHALAVYDILNQRVDDDFVYQFIKSEEIASSFAEYYRQQACGMTQEERKRVLMGKTTDSMIKRYSKMPFDRKWNTSAYLLGFIQRDAEKAEKIFTQMEVAASINSVIVGQYKYSNQYEINVDQLLESLRNAGMYDEEVEPSDLIRIWNGFGIDKMVTIPSDFSKENLGEMLMDWHLIMRDTYVENDSMSTMWTEIYKCWLEKREGTYMSAISDIGKTIEHVFDFLDEINEDDTLQERFYLEICSNKTLLSAVSSGDCRKFVRMCQKQYGIA